MIDHVSRYDVAVRDPPSVYDTPEQVLADPRLDVEGRRAILRSWERKTQAGQGFPAETPKAKQRAFHERIRKSLEKLEHGEDNRFQHPGHRRSGN